MPLFDSYLMVDWSAARRPVTGRDSIWWALVERSGDGPRLVARKNPSTRADATAAIAERLADLSAVGRRVLAGFDFPFGYAAGTAARLDPGDGTWRGVWRRLTAEVRDGPDNANDRFEVAARLNEVLTGEAFPFWGHDGGRERPLLLRRGRRPHGPHDLAERRLCERRLKRTQPAWKLAGAGAVGGQALLGIPRLGQLRDDPRLAAVTRVWPFETGLAAPGVKAGDIVLAEVYPSLVEPQPEDEMVKDARQVRTVAEHFATLDASDALAPLFAADPALSAEERRAVETEEAWILGVAGAAPAAAGPGFDYLRDPAEIYRKSFATVRAEADLSRLPPDLASVAVRLVHACGMPDIVADLAWTPDLAASARKALAAGAPILADCRMVCEGIIRGRLPAGNEVICTLDDPEVPARATRAKTTRSAAAVELWAPRLEGAVVAIGNAPTALFRLLELLRDGAPKPAAILGFPVGFVGAAESKQALIEAAQGVPYLALRGRRGGSALAAAAVNALAGDEA